MTVTPKKRFPFNKTTVAALPAAEPGGRDTYYDQKVQHLMLRVTDTGVKTFYVYRWADSKPLRRSLGKFPDMTVEQARDSATSMNDNLNKGIDPAAEKRAREEAAKRELTLQELFDAYIDRHAKKKRKTADVMQADFARVFDNAASPYKWAKRKACEITSNDVERLHGELGRTKPYRANRTIQLLRSVYNKAIQWKLFFGDNPATGITLFEEEKRQRFLQPDEMPRLFAELAALPDHDDLKDFVLLSLLGGQRKSNTLSAEWAEFDLQQGRWIIPAYKTKTGKPYIVPLTGDEVSLLAARATYLESKKIKSPFVFPSTGKTGHLVDPKRSWTSLRLRAGLLPPKPIEPGKAATATQAKQYQDELASWRQECDATGITIHDLRRSLGSWLAGQNVQPQFIKNVMQHADLKTTMSVYAHTTNAGERSAKELGHNAMLVAAGVREKKDNVVPLREEAG